VWHIHALPFLIFLLCPLVIAYLNQADFVAPALDAIDENYDPVGWWRKTMGPVLKQNYPDRKAALEDVAAMILSLRVSAACVERAHSKFQHLVGDKTRNKLTAENLEMTALMRINAVDVEEK
jgi:hypothetical protein